MIRLIHIFTMVVVLMSLLQGCQKNKKSGDQLPKILVVATSADNPPFEFYSTSDNLYALQGFDIDLAEALGDALGVKIIFQESDFVGLLMALKSGRVDMVMAELSPNAERQQNFDFSEIYIDFPMAFITTKKHRITTVADLTHQNVGVQLGTSYERFLKKISDDVEGLKLLSLNRLGMLIEELKLGRITCILTGQQIASAYVEHSPELMAMCFGDNKAHAAIALAKNSPLTGKINTALQQLRDNGILQRLQQKWFKDI